MVSSNQKFKYNLPWHCDICGEKGLQGFDDDSDIGLIELSIEMNHRKKSPQCSCWYSQLKVGWRENGKEFGVSIIEKNKGLIGTLLAIDEYMEIKNEHNTTK